MTALFKIVTKIIKFCAVLILIVILTLFIALQTPSGQREAIALLLPYLEKEIGLKVQLEQMHFSMPCHVEFKNIILQESDHNIATVDSLNIAFHCTDLLKGILNCRLISMEGLEVIALPNQFAQNASSNTKAQFFHYWPVYFKIDEIEIKNLHLRDEILTKYISNELIKNYLRSSFF